MLSHNTCTTLFTTYLEYLQIVLVTIIWQIVRRLILCDGVRLPAKYCDYSISRVAKNILKLSSNSSSSTTSFILWRCQFKLEVFYLRIHSELAALWPDWSDDRVIGRRYWRHWANIKESFLHQLANTRYHSIFMFSF